jgi:hypothetical protein
MNDIDYFKPIKNFACFFIAVPIIFCIVLIVEPPSGSNEQYMLVWSFVIFISFFHLPLGIGILLKKNWGLVFFKAYLKLLYFGFPIGTYISKKTLEYINEYEIQRYFK